MRFSRLLQCYSSLEIYQNNVGYHCRVFCYWPHYVIPLGKSDETICQDTLDPWLYWGLNRLFPNSAEMASKPMCIIQYSFLFTKNIQSNNLFIGDVCWFDPRASKTGFQKCSTSTLLGIMEKEFWHTGFFKYVKNKVIII